MFVIALQGQAKGANVPLGLLDCNFDCAVRCATANRGFLKNSRCFAMLGYSIVYSFNGGLLIVFL